MFRRTSSDRMAKKIKLLLLQKSAEQKTPTGSIRLTPEETAEDRFLKAVIDVRLTAEENVILVHKLSEVREAVVAMILSNREISHDRDFVAG